MRGRGRCAYRDARSWPTRLAGSAWPGAMVSNMAELDPELQAMQSIIGALDPLDDEARQRVIDYAFTRLGLTRKEPEESIPDPQAVEEAPPRPVGTDVRTLREEKEPKSANEMAAIVGYYLAELVPEKKTEIGTSDVETYFKQANFPLPQVARKTLPNAAAAGYFEAVGDGRYKLNPVGHNLVAHTLPRKSKAPRKRPSRTRSKSKATKRPTKKSQASKKPRRRS